MFNKNLVLISGACLFKETRGKRRWFIVKQTDEDGWEVPKVLVRKGESSVRAALRMIGEKGGITARVLEEAGRAGGVTTTNGKTLPQRHIYYLMLTKLAADETIGFPEFAWLEYAKATRKLNSKREKQMLKAANEVLKKWKKEREKRRSG
jgi:ADP-ribose pyrophosphatase YjhB (NUDIX family)